MRGRGAAVVCAGLVVLALAAVAYSCAGPPATAPGPGGGAPVPVRDASSYAGLGAWVDVFDYAPAYQDPGQAPVLAPAVVDVLAAQGVRTLFLQATRHDDRSPEDVVDRRLVGEFLSRAHAAGMRVVGWYLPTFGDVDGDLANLLLIRDFSYDGHRFDGLAVDIEFRAEVPDPTERNRRLVDLSTRLRRAVGDDAVGAIVPPPVLLEVVNPDNWPDFPWPALAPLYDVWLPMTYWTFRTEASGYRDGHRYTEESVRRLRANLAAPAAPMHPIAGIGDEATEADVAGFVEAAGEAGAVGLSMYDARTTSHGAAAVLRRGARALESPAPRG